MQGYTHTPTPKGGCLIALLFVGLLVSVSARANEPRHDSGTPSHDFNTAWISDCQPDSLSHVWFRRMYVTGGRPRQATLTVTTTGRVKAYVNACNVGTAPYYPLRDDTDHRPVSITFDVTPYMNADTNVVALLYSPASPSLTDRQVAVTLYGTGRDRRPFSYTTDADWLCRKANSGLTPDGDEWIDGRDHNPYWNTTAYAAALWLPVKTPSTPLSPLSPSTPSTPLSPINPLNHPHRDAARPLCPRRQSLSPP